MDHTSDRSLIENRINNEIAEDSEALDAAPLPHPMVGDQDEQTANESQAVHIPWADTESETPPLVSEAQVGTGRRRSRRNDTSARRHKPRTAKAHLFVTLAHWGMVLLLGFSLISGMRIGWGYMESPLGGGEGLWGAILHATSPEGSLFGVNLITLHVLLAFGLLAISGIYTIYMFQSRASRRLQVTRQDLKRLKQGLLSGDMWRNKAALWTANLLVYWLSFVFIGVLTVTGIALYRLDWGISSTLGGYELNRLLHAIVAYLFIPYVVLHMVLQWMFGRFWTIFKAQLYRPHIRAGLIGIALTVPVIAAVYIGNEVAETLTAPRLAAGQQMPVLDGEPNDPAWNLVEAVTIRTVKGVNNPEEHVDISIKAVHDGAQVYFQFQWPDPDVSYKRFPLIKRVDGWEVLETAKAYGDENVYYEDKLSMYITDVTNGNCSDTCHVGTGPHADRGEKHGMHYTSKGEIGDVWHWKAVRLNSVGDLVGEPGFMDDQHFRASDPIPEKLTERFKGGYHTDPKTGGGYSYNYVKLDPDKSLRQTFVRPKMFPPTHAYDMNSDPSTHDQGNQWWIHKSEAVPYSPELDDEYPIGAVIPNILVSPLQGDRANVRAKAEWRDGVWTLEARRALDTGSKYDVAFSTERPVYLSIGAFNRTQTRHSEHIKPIKLVLEK